MDLCPGEHPGIAQHTGSSVKQRQQQQRRGSKLVAHCTSRQGLAIPDHYVSLINLSNQILKHVSVKRLQVRFISFTCQPIPVIIATLIIHHSFILPLQVQNLPFQQILPTLTLLLYSLNCLHDHGTGPDLPRSSVYFSFFFLNIFSFVPCGRLSWLSVSFLLQIKYILSYPIISYVVIESEKLQSTNVMVSLGLENGASHINEYD